MSLKKYAVPTHPLCSAGAVLQGENYRISMLTTALIRFEYSEDGKFEDHATQMVYNREFPVPEFRVVEKEETLDIYTKNLEIHYDKQKFTPGGLLDTLRGDWDAMQVEWQEREYGITEKRRKIFGELQELWTGPTVKSRWNMELCQKTDFLF